MVKPAQFARIRTGAILIALAAGIVWPLMAVAQSSGWTHEWPDTDFTKTRVDLGEIMSGGPPKDGIPAIDAPRFVDYAAADGWLDPREPVISVAIGGEARAYPLQILMFHEIVNDVLHGTPVAVTFCPLCNAAIVFDRRLGDRVLDFGTTGKLRNSDLVMYDRQSQSWWQQFTGEAIVGALAGTVLVRRNAVIVSYQDFKQNFPGGRVLSRNTGYSRPYGRNPYRGYDSITSTPFLYRDPLDPRLPPMERVVNVSAGGVHRLYPFSLLAATPVINDTVNGVPVVVLSRPGTLTALGNAVIRAARTIPSAAVYRRTLDGDDPLTFQWRDGRLVDSRTGSRWNLFGRAVTGPLAGRQLAPVDAGVHFAFAWLAFHPDSQIYTVDN